MSEHGVYVAMRVDLPGRDVLVDLPLTSLPFLGPEPRL